MADALQTIKARAQLDATREGKRMMVLNLNRFNPLHVVRLYDARAEGTPALVAVIDPLEWPETV